MGFRIGRRNALHVYPEPRPPAQAASVVPYTPSTPANWDGNVPTTVQQALDDLAKGTRAYTPTATPVVIPVGLIPNTGLTILCADFTPTAEGLTLVSINLDLVLNQADTISLGLWVAAPLVSFANNVRIDAGGASQPIEAPASNAGLTVNPVITTGTFANRNQQNIATAPFEGNGQLSACLQLTPGQRTAIGVEISAGIGTTTVTGRGTASFIELPLR